MTVEIPTVDLQALASDNRGTKQRATEAIRVGFGQFGLVYVAGHDIDFGQRDALYQEFLAFTARPLAEKKALSGSDIWFQRGWTPPNTERAVVAAGQPDFKECYFCAPMPIDAACAIEYPEIHANNIWPPNAAAFREGYLALGTQLHHVGEQLLDGCAAALSLPNTAFTQLIEGGPHVCRLLRYLPVDQAQLNAGVVWGEEHTDFNLLTLLPGGRFVNGEGHFCARPDNRSGLYLRTRPSAAAPRGRKVRGQPPEGCLVAQVGQQLEILTGGAFLATPHVITAPQSPEHSRVSCAHFVHMHSHKVVFPLPQFLTNQTLAAYRPPVLAGTYGIKTLVDIGLAPASAIDQLGYRHYHRLASIRRDETPTRTDTNPVG